MTTKKKIAKKSAAASATKKRLTVKTASARPVARTGKLKKPVVAKSAPARSQPKTEAVRRRVVVSKAKTAQRKTTPKKSRVAKPKKKAPEIPSYLLSGDFPEPIVAAPPAAAMSGVGSGLPEAYGTQQLIVTAQDSRWLYASWDYTRQQLQEVEARSSQGRLHLRVHLNEITEHPYLEIQLPPGTRHWFVHVDKPGTKFFGELGYYDNLGLWCSLGKSEATFTPPEAPSMEKTVRLATIPPEVPLQKVVAAVKAAAAENKPLAEALARTIPAVGGQLTGAELTREREQVLEQLITLDSLRRVWIGSMEITELVRRQLGGEQPPGGLALPPQQIASPGVPFGAAAQAPSSAQGPSAPPSREFWFNINAEIVIYGATEPDAEVTLGGRPIQLRPDGTFSCRFALPDGNYELPAVAISADRTDGRAAELKFSRRTDYRGDVGVQPQDQSLEPPPPENGA